MTIQDIQKTYELSKEPNVDFWHHQQSGQWILTHNAIEKIAIMENIWLKDIKILNTEYDLVRFLVTMRNDKAKEVTSIGEADRKNCKSQYLGCIAEKRGIDRCVLKLINAYQYGISSEVEAEDFAKPKYYSKTENQLQKFDDMLKDSVFSNQPKGEQRPDLQRRFKELKTLSEVELFLSQMQARIKTHNNGELENENK